MTRTFEAPLGNHAAQPLAPEFVGIPSISNELPETAFLSMH